MTALDNLGINLWSVLIHFVNIFSLVLILTFVLYKPLLKMMSERKRKIVTSIDEIEILKKEFDEKLMTMRQERESLHATYQEQMSKGQKEVEEQKAILLAEMQTTREKLLQETQHEMEMQKKEILQTVQKEVLTAMQKIVTTVIKSNMDTPTIAKSVQDQWEKHLSSQT